MHISFGSETIIGYSCISTKRGLVLVTKKCQALRSGDAKSLDDVL